MLTMVLVGGGVALQPAVNAGLSRAVGALPAAMVSFGVGFLALFALVLVAGQLADVAALTEVRWYYLLGGLFGAAWIATSLIAISSLGAGGVVAATVTGQMLGAVVIDRLGILGLQQVPITPVRLLGACLLVIGTYLVVRGT